MAETLQAASISAATATPERNIRKSTLPNGMLVLTESMSHMRSVSMGVWIGTGSRDESAAQNGISHFVEHMVFKGTTSRDAKQLARETDAIGGNLDAFTGKETVCFNIKVLDENVPRAMDILADLVLHPTFAADDIQREQSVILEEIKMDEDNPDYLVHELHVANFWKGDPLARSILGTAKTVSSFDADAVRSFHAARFTPANMVFSAAGNLEHDSMLALIEEHFGGLQPGDFTHDRSPAPVATPHITLRNKKSLEQVQLCLGVPSPAVDSPDRFVLYLLNNILGGGMSSRLFQTVREEAGLAYSIYSELSPFRDTGALNIYAGTSIEKTPEMIELILKELRLLKDEPVSDEELTRAKDQSKGNIILGLESSASRMSNLARQQMYYGRFISTEEITEEVNRVSAADIQRVARELFIPERISLTLLGNLGDLKVTREQLAC
ncbi:M16 family metallopeptidase [Terriglobus aquaticus]|uniref:M16 family metallopeptidase n=1 Tax=Terriglobus aquaticus TaxID=940139 RepID=A0ABW9KKQ3_9BACT|nr:pitrilysin family protein [Terriglobus aquaticus]